MRRLTVFFFSCIMICVTLSAQPGGGGYRGGYGGGHGQWQGQGQWQQGRGGNSNFGVINGKVWLSPDDPEGKEEPGVGVVVTIISSKKDTLHTSVGDNGRFAIFRVPTGKAFVRFSMLGYSEEAKTVDIQPGENKVVVYLKPKPLEIEEAVLKETVPPVSVNKDTIIFNAAAVKVNKDEMAIDILEQMPGVEVTESGVTVLNEAVSNVYVDGALLFGEAPMRALNNLPAEEVLTIKSYQEYANKDPYHKINKNESKERVLDVRTKSRPKFVTNGDFMSGLGFDTDSTYHKLRYTLGGTIGAYSEKLQAHLNANVNNINDGGNRQRGNSFRSAGGGGSADLRDLSLNANFNKKWMSPTARNFVLGSVGGSYSYNNNYKVNESLNQRIYFPTDKYETRTSESSSYSDATNKSHNFSINGNKALRDGRISANASYNISDSRNNSRSTSYNYQDNLAPQGTSSGRTSNSGNHSYNAGFNFNKRFNGKVGLHFNASISQSNNESSSTKVDTTTATITRTVLDIGGTGSSRKWGLSPSIRFEIGETRSISAGYNYSYNYSTTQQLAYDVTDDELSKLDIVNSYTYVTNNNSHSAHINYRSYWEKFKTILDVNLPFSSTGLNRDESFPEEDFYNHRFNAFNPSVRIGNESMLNHWHLELSTGHGNPSLNQVRPKINNNNLYSVSAGNPNLKQSRSYKGGVSYSTVLGSASRQIVRDMEAAKEEDDLGMRVAKEPTNVRSLSTFSWSAGFSTELDPIVNRRIYYAEETFLPDYNYTMPAQSTFSSYENAGESYSANTSARFDIPLLKIMCTLNASASFDWDNSPNYVNYVLTRTENIRPSIRLGLRSNFSRNFRINVNGNASYVYSSNDQKDNTSYFVERINLGWEVNNILRHGWAGGNYMKSFTQGLTYGKINDNIFNANAGFKWGPRNNYNLSVSINDLFNKITGFSTSQRDDYINNSWNHNFGRYVMFRFTYRFNSMRGKGGARVGGRFGTPGSGSYGQGGGPSGGSGMGGRGAGRPGAGRPDTGGRR